MLILNPRSFRLVRKSLTLQVRNNDLNYVHNAASCIFLYVLEISSLYALVLVWHTALKYFSIGCICLSSLLSHRRIILDAQVAAAMATAACRRKLSRIFPVFKL